MKAIILIALIAISFAHITVLEPFITEEKLLSHKNSSFETYSYDEHPFKNWSLSDVENMMGIKSFIPFNINQTPYLEKSDEYADLPESFDARQQWPNCVHAIRNQGKCGSCWAFAASEVLSDRFCIASGEKINTVLSPQDLVSCDYLDMGCNGGNPVFSWVYLRTFGIVSDSCKPYTAGEGHVDHCKLFSHKCVNDDEEYKKYKAGSLPQIMSGNINAIKKSLVEHGPVETGFQVYEDFMSYKSGIYSHSTGKLLGGHAVKIVGYGIENGTEYWIVANSWGESWGENGFFRIKFGDCGFENMAIAATADV